jgi:hypothetical protein
VRELAQFGVDRVIVSIDGVNKQVCHYAFGSVHEQRLADIWMSEEYTRFRSEGRMYHFPSCPTVTCVKPVICASKMKAAGDIIFPAPIVFGRRISSAAPEVTHDTCQG